MCRNGCAEPDRWVCPLDGAHRICRVCWQRTTALASRPLGADGPWHEKERGVVMRCWGAGCAHVVGEDELRSIVGSIAADAWLSSRAAKITVMRAMAEGRSVVPCAACGAALFDDDTTPSVSRTCCSCGTITCADPRCHMARVSATTSAARCSGEEDGGPSPQQQQQRSSLTHANCVAPASRPPWTCASAVEWLRLMERSSCGAFDLATLEALVFLVRTCLVGWQSATRCPACGEEADEGGELCLRCVACGTQWCRSCAREACDCDRAPPPDALAQWPATLARARLRRVREIAGRGTFSSFVRTCGDVFAPRIEDAWPSFGDGESEEGGDDERHPWIEALVSSLLDSTRAA